MAGRRRHAARIRRGAADLAADNVGAAGSETTMVSPPPGVSSGSTVPPIASASPADLVRTRVDGSPLTAAAALVWSGDLPRLLQQVLFDTADSVVF